MSKMFDDDECPQCGDFIGTNFDCPTCESVRREDAKMMKQENKEVSRVTKQREDEEGTRRRR